MNNVNKISDGIYYLHYIPLDIAYLKTDKFINTLITYFKHGILSRRLLKQHLEYEKDYRFYGGNFNDYDYIPLTYVNGNADEDNNIIGNDLVMFYEFPALIISPSIEEYLTFRTDEHQKMLHEIQIKDRVPSEYIIGLRLPFDNKVLEDENISSDEIIAVLDPYERIYQYLNELGYNITLYSNNNLMPIPRIGELTRNLKR